MILIALTLHTPTLHTALTPADEATLSLSPDFITGGMDCNDYCSDTMTFANFNLGPMEKHTKHSDLINCVQECEDRFQVNHETENKMIETTTVGDVLKALKKENAPFAKHLSSVLKTCWETEIGEISKDHRQQLVNDLSGATQALKQIVSGDGAAQIEKAEKIVQKLQQELDSETEQVGEMAEQSMDIVMKKDGEWKSKLSNEMYSRWDGFNTMLNRQPWWLHVKSMYQKLWMTPAFKMLRVIAFVLLVTVSVSLFFLSAGLHAFVVAGLALAKLFGGKFLGIAVGHVTQAGTWMHFNAVTFPAVDAFCMAFHTITTPFLGIWMAGDQAVHEFTTEYALGRFFRRQVVKLMDKAKHLMQLCKSHYDAFNNMFIKATIGTIGCILEIVHVLPAYRWVRTKIDQIGQKIRGTTPAIGTDKKKRVF